MNNKIILLALAISITQYSYGDQKELIISTSHKKQLEFNNYDNKYGGWSTIEYRNEFSNFKIYSLPSKEELNNGKVVAISDPTLISQDRNFLILQRTTGDEITDDEGNEVISSQTYCDVISLKSGCIDNLGSTMQCDGAWKDNLWVTSSGEVFDPSERKNPPKQLLQSTVKITNQQNKSSALVDALFMGANSYMACFPPQDNIANYNDIAFFLANGGEHLLAMEFYKRLLSFASDRIPLQLNTADSLWALGQHDEAKLYYRNYYNLMIKKNIKTKIPSRVLERI